MSDSVLQVLPPDTQRRLRSAQHSAIVFMERDPGGALPAGWGWELANARVSQLLSQWLAEADAGWSATVVPEENAPAMAAMKLPASAVVGYNGQLRLGDDALKLPKGGEPLCIIVNGRLFPFCDLEEAIQLHRQGRADATFFDVCEQRAVRTYDERLRVGPDGRVKRVDRVYGPEGAPEANPAWPAFVILSRSGVEAMSAAPLPQRMVEWPAALLRAGVRVQGTRIGGRCFDLADADSQGELGDALLRLRPQWIIQAGALSEHAPRIWVGKNVELPASAEVIGPVAIGDGAQIGEHAILVGPTCIGRQARVGSRVVVRRAVIPAGASVVSDPLAAADGASDIPALKRALAPERLIRLQTVLEAHPAAPLGTFRHAAYQVAKRGMDIAGALVFLCFTLAFYPLVAAAIKLNSAGPVFYGHPRQGRGGRLFRCWKFRTMVVNAEEIKQSLMAHNEVDGPQFKIKCDPRIFFVGRWLRRLNIDEWPQAWNVLLGQMSLVGPRPSPEKENQMCPAWREARLSVRPGITGLWQVSRQRGGETDFQEWIYYDVQYVKRQSLWLDVQILFKTIAVALRGS